jgi:hypothetical protein
MDPLGVIASLDWISPLIQIVQGLGGMPTINATVPGWTGAEVKNTLEQAGIRCGAGMIVGDTLLLPVADPERAEAVLTRLRGGQVTPGMAGATTVRSPGPRAPRPVRGRSRLWSLLDGKEGG